MKLQAITAIFGEYFLTFRCF